MRVSTLQPGLLVGLKTFISGNVKYKKQVIVAEHIDSDGAAREQWETERTVINPDEYKRATQVRGQARSLVAKVCVDTGFGLLCRESRRPDLDAAVAAARALADEFNATATLTTISVNVVAATVARDDAEAIRSVNREMTELLDTMTEGLKSLDVKAVRAAAVEAKKLAEVLTVDASARAIQAIDAARALATRIKKTGEIGANEIDQASLEIIARSRTEFLDLTPAVDVREAVDTTEHLIDLAPEAEPVSVPEPVTIVELSDGDSVALPYASVEPVTQIDLSAD